MPLLSLPANANQTQELCKEAVTRKHLVHPNVLPLLGVTIDNYQLILKWVFGGNLPEYIQKYPDADKLRLVRVFFATILVIRHIAFYQLCDVAEGLRYLHSCSVIHGDLKGVRNCSAPCFIPH